jgi:hypothetical protein
MGAKTSKFCVRLLPKIMPYQGLQGREKQLGYIKSSPLAHRPNGPLQMQCILQGWMALGASPGLAKGLGLEMDFMFTSCSCYWCRVLCLSKAEARSKCLKSMGAGV